MKSVRVVCVILLMIFPFLSSCLITVVEYGESESPLRESFRKTVHFTPGGTVSIFHTEGDVVIQGWDKEEVQIYAEKMILFPYEDRIRIWRGRPQYPQINVEAVVDLLNIKTEIPDESEFKGAVDYLIRLPQSIEINLNISGGGQVTVTDFYGNVSVDLNEGNLSVENFSGSLKAFLKTGSINAQILDLRREDEIAISTQKGDIILSLPSDVEASLEGSAPNGKIDCEFDVKTESPALELSVQIGEGGTDISVTASQGNIKIKKRE